MDTAGPEIRFGFCEPDPPLDAAVWEINTDAATARHLPTATVFQVYL